jgi:hypothetical protein
MNFEEIDKDFELLKEYLFEKIERCKPVTLKYQILNYSKSGFIDYGTSWDKLPNFETWKKIKNLKYAFCVPQGN